MTGLDLQELRKSLGLTQELLAKELGVSRPTISVWEKADKVPNSRLIELAFEALKRLPDTRNWHRDGSYSATEYDNG